MRSAAVTSGGTVNKLKKISLSRGQLRRHSRWSAETFRQRGFFVQAVDLDSQEITPRKGLDHHSLGYSPV